MPTAQQSPRRTGPGQGANFSGNTFSHLRRCGLLFLLQNRDNELAARTLKDQQNLLQTENQQVKAQIDKLQSGMAQFDSLLKIARKNSRSKPPASRR